MDLRPGILIALFFETLNLLLPSVRADATLLSCYTYLLPLVASFHCLKHLEKSRLQSRQVRSVLFVLAIELERAFARLCGELRMSSLVLLPGQG